MTELIIKIIEFLSGKEIDRVGTTISTEAYKDSSLFILNIFVSLTISAIIGAVAWFLITRHQNRGLALERKLQRLTFLNELDREICGLVSSKGILLAKDKKYEDAHTETLEYFLYNNIDCDSKYITKTIKSEGVRYQSCISNTQDLLEDYDEAYVSRDLLEKIKFMFFKYARGIEGGFIGGKDIAAINPPIQNFAFRKFFSFLCSVLYDLDGLEGHTESELHSNAIYRIDIFMPVFTSLMIYHARVRNLWVISMLLKQSHSVVLISVYKLLYSKKGKELALDPSERDKIFTPMKIRINIYRAKKFLLNEIKKELTERGKVKYLQLGVENYFSHVSPCIDLVVSSESNQLNNENVTTH